jgi:hypothetical protein
MVRNQRQLFKSHHRLLPTETNRRLSLFKWQLVVAAPTEKNMPIIIRTARLTDLQQITNIYNYHVSNSAYTFELVPFQSSEREQWFNKYDKTGPHRLLVATGNDDVMAIRLAGFSGESLLIQRR